MNRYFPSKFKRINDLDLSGASYSSRNVRIDGARETEGSNRDPKPQMYSPPGHLAATEFIIKLSAAQSQSSTVNSQTAAWSSPFTLVPASGSTSIVVPQPCNSGAYLISATVITVSGELTGRTRVITFQPRYFPPPVIHKTDIPTFVE